VDDSHTLRLYNWADYIGEKTLSDFEKPPASK
jgi:putrescine transport system substrate-binding protein